MTDAAARSSLARRFLGLNALFSGVCGLALLFLATPVAALLFVDGAGWGAILLRVIGVGLIVFAVDLGLMSRDRFVAKAMVLTISAADLVWVVGSGVVLAMFGDLLTPIGQEVVLGVAVVVAMFGAGQFVGARRLRAPLSTVTARTEDGVLHLRVRRAVDAPATIVWQVMTDHPGYADVASNIAKVEVLSGDGLGMVRRCTDPKGASWLERCEHYLPNKEFGFTIDTDAPDYPYPIAALQGRWSVTPMAKGTAAFTIDINARPKGNALQRRLFMALAGPQFKPVLIDLADAWAARMEREAALSAPMAMTG